MKYPRTSQAAPTAATCSRSIINMEKDMAENPIMRKIVYKNGIWLLVDKETLIKSLRLGAANFSPDTTRGGEKTVFINDPREIIKVLDRASELFPKYSVPIVYDDASFEAHRLPTWGSLDRSAAREKLRARLTHAPEKGRATNFVDSLHVLLGRVLSVLFVGVAIVFLLIMLSNGGGSGGGHDDPVWRDRR